MAKKFLDDSGLGFFWSKIKSYIDNHDYKLNYTTSGRNYKVSVDSDKNLYVNVPWTDNNTTYDIATTTTNGLMSSVDKSKLDGIETNANNYIHPTTSGNKHIPSGGSSGQILRWSADGTAVWGNDNNTTYGQANSTTLGLVKIGFPESGKNYPVELNSSGQMFVNVPWTDNNTTYGLVGGNGSTGLVKNGSSVTSASGYIACPIIGGIPYYKDTNTTYSLGSFGITATAAELNYCDGVTSNIQTQLNGKAASSHSHSWSSITSKPSTFTPSSHSHSWSNITSGVPATATRWPSWSEVTSKPSTFTPSSHSHESITATVTGSNSKNIIYANIADNDQFRLRVGGTASNAGYVEFATADDGNEPIYFRQYSGVFTTLKRTATILDANGNTSFPGTINAPYLNGRLSRETNTNTVSTLTSIPTSKALVIANLSKATTISVASGMAVGDSITVICNPSAAFTQPIPTTGAYKSMDGDSLKVTAGKPFEINILCYASGKYSISCKVSK